MSCNIDPSEVLYYLNELGYTNITAAQLKCFIKDLKKLIKYEHRQELLDNKENVEELSKQSEESTKRGYEQEVTDSIFTALHNTSTIASRAKKVSKKESVISVEINRPINVQREIIVHQQKSEPLVHTCKSTSTASNEKSVDSAKSITKSSSAITETETRTTKELHKPKSFIRPRKPPKPCKSDPVALYHRYQEEWKRIKIPGVDNRANLRWMVRERMLGDNY